MLYHGSGFYYLPMLQGSRLGKTFPLNLIKHTTAKNQLSDPCLYCFNQLSNAHSTYTMSKYIGKQVIT